MSSTRPILHVSPLLIRTLVFAGLMLHAAVGQAAVASDIKEDKTLGTIVIVNQAGNRFDINGGTPRERNLFHSFLKFILGTNHEARFNGPSDIRNIIARVTGGQQSFIDGLLRSTIPGANLFLLNPSGVMFGANARLDVSGSFHVSTANYLKFADGAKFFADLSHDSVLTAAAPAAFGFLGQTPPATITVDRSRLQFTATDRTLSVAGGNVEIKGATLAAPGGRIQIASVLEGEVPLSEGKIPLSFDVKSVNRLGQVQLSQGANLTVSSPAGAGTVLIRGGRLIADNSSIRADTQGDVNGARLGVDLQVAEDILLRNGASIRAATTRAGSAGDVRIAAGSLEMQGSAFIATQTTRDGTAGEISVNVGRLSLKGGGRIDSISSGAGQGGNVTVRVTDSASISGQDSGLSTQTELGARGNGGRLAIFASSLTLDDGGTIRSITGGNGHGGDISVQAGSLSLTRGGAIRSRVNGGGAGGKLTVTDTDSVVLSGGGTGIFSSSFQLSTGQVGDISLLNVGKLTLTGGAVIQSGFGRVGENPNGGGNVTVNARESIIISNGSSISNQAFSQDVSQVVISAPSLIMDNGFIRASTIGAGRAGDISVDVGKLTLTGGAQVVSSVEGNASGRGGNLTVKATDSVSISGRSNSGLASGLFSTSSKTGTGNAGKITVSGPTLTLSDGGKISVATEGRGRAGEIALNVNRLSLMGGARIESGTTGAGQGGTVTVNATDSISISGGAGLFSNAEGSGRGGNIDLRAGQIQLSDGATISARSTGNPRATAGNISITAGDRFVSQNSTVTTEALQAAGGKIDLRAGSLVYLNRSKVTTSVKSGDPAAGNITIDPQFVVLNHSQIRADAFGGPGGNVNITANVYLTQDSIVSASSARGVPGTINIQASITDVSGSLAQLPEAVLQASALLRASCAARLAGGKASSLVLAGRDGLPLEPGGLLPSPLFEGGTLGAPSGGQTVTFQSLPPSRFSLFGSNDESLRPGRAWNQRGLSQAAFNLGCPS